MPILYEENPSLNGLVQHFIETLQEFEPLLAGSVRVKPLLREKTKANKDGCGELVESKPTISAKKVPDLFYQMGGGDRSGTHYVLLFDKYAWERMDTKEREANVHAALMMLEPKTKQNGDVTYKLKKPDVVTFKATLARFGAYDGDIDLVRQTLEDTSRRIATRLTSTPTPETDGEPVESSVVPRVSRRSGSDSRVLSGEET